MPLLPINWINLLKPTEVGDILAPTVLSMVLGSLADNRIVITCSEPLDTGSVPAVGDFALAGISVPIDSISVQGSTIWVILKDNVPDNYTLTLSYTAGANPIQDAAHNNLANFTTQSVTNSSSDHADVVLSIAFTATQFVFKWKAPAGNDVTFHEGEGTTQTVSGADASLRTTTFSHSGAGTYDVWLSGDDADLTYIDISGQSFVSGDVSGWSALTKLTVLRCSTTSIEGDVSGWSALTSLTSLNCSATSIEGDVSGWSALTSLTSLSCSATSVTFDATPAWTNASATIRLESCGLDSTMVDNSIASLSTCTSCTINISGTNAHRTAASNDDLNTLLANGNSVTLNDTLSAEKITDGAFPDATNWDVTDASWAIAAGVSTYDDANDDAGLIQTDGNMASSIAVDTVYRAAFTTDATPTNAAIAIKNAAEDVVYFAQANYTDGTHVIYFTTPGAISGGGIAFVAYQAGDAYTLDDVSLKTVTFP